MPMLLEKAIELLATQAQIDPTNLTNAFLTANIMTIEDAEKAQEALQPALLLLGENPTFKHFIAQMTEAGRQQYRYQGRSLESLNASIFLGGFIGGLQFMLNGMKSADPYKAHAATDPSPSPQPLVN